MYCYFNTEIYQFLKQIFSWFLQITFTLFFFDKETQFFPANE